MTTTTLTLADQASNVLTAADFDYLWPNDVTETLVKATETEGDLPAYAIKQVEWALRQADRIERSESAAFDRAQQLKNRRF